MRVVAVTALFALVGCSAVLGADFDRAGAVDPKTTGSNTVPVGEDGACPPARKRCGNACALVDDPAFGCGDTACTPCAAPDAATATCSATLACEFTCPSGFERRADRCVGWRIERQDFPDVFLNVWGRGPGDVYVTGGVPWGTPQNRRTGDGTWQPQLTTTGRYIVDIRGTSRGELFAATEGWNAPSDQPSSYQPLLRLGPSGWEAMGIGAPARTSASSVWAASDDDVYVLDDGQVPATVRHFFDGAWHDEPLDVDGMLIAGVEASNGAAPSVFVVDVTGGVVQRLPTGKWAPVFTPPTHQHVMSAWGIANDRRCEGCARSLDLYLAGWDGLLVRLSGVEGTAGTMRSTVLSSGTTEILTRVWGSSPNDIWVVGFHGTILHGTADGHFASVPSGTSANLNGLWGSGPDDIYVTGNTGPEGPGLLLHRH